MILRGGYREGCEEAHRLLGYLALLEKWNTRINLTASTDWSALGWLFEEALWAARFYPSAPVTHLDVGSGAGFPAVPLRILRPAMRLHLVESRGKRAAFLATVAADLRLEGTEVVCARVEEFLRGPAVPAFDIVSCKGLKLSAEAVDLLLAASRPTTQLWLFHGRTLPLEHAARARAALRRLRQEHLPGHTARSLSIYGVSRETGST